MPSKAHIVVLGAGYAGLIAAGRAARKARNLARVTIVGARPDFVERMRLHQETAGHTLRAWPVQQLLTGAPARFVQRKVTGIDPERHRVQLAGRTLDYDLLIITLGNHVDRTSIRGLEHAHTLN